MNEATCSIDGCSTAVTARGWCEPHYRRWRRHGSPLGGRTAPGDGACSVATCGRGHYARGWCRLHYERWRAHGTPTPPVLTVAERFWSKVAVGDSGECWSWTAARTEHGYGKFGVGRASKLAPRLALELATGRAIPSLQKVLHSCDNPPCCNPAHLSVGTQLQNMADMVARGRSLKGERHHQSRLTESAVAEIRRAWDDEEATQRALAQRFGISAGTVADVVYRRTWAHIA